MKYDLIARAAQLLRRGGRHRRWRRAVSGLAAVVVFVTSYMLILPALTLEQDTICGLEEHTHTDACYEQRLVCTLEESEPVYEDQQVLTCTLPEGEGHAHTEACYGLTCALEESAGHTHTEACYTAVSELTCTQAESEGHTHADGCYGLICGQEECAGHTHTDACYTTQQVQVSGHTHTDACYEQALICGLPEHTHDESCYPAQEEELVCELSQHTHGEGCYDADGNLTCTLPEHTHGEECYALVEIPEEDVPMTAFPEVIPEGYEKYSFDNGSGLVVTAYAPENAFPVGAELFAEVLAEDSEEYAQAKENLDKAENAPEYTGMAAMDIRFVDAAAEDPAAAEEIEPDASLGQVYVDIQAQALIPEDVDESTLAVQHHVETESDKIFGLIPNVFDPTVTTVETVADNSDTTGTVTAAPAAVQTLDLTEEDSAPAAQDVEARFAVESFSTFTITWGGNKNLYVSLVDESGASIGQGGLYSFTPDTDTAVFASALAPEISDYEFDHAEVNTGWSTENWVEFTNLRMHEETEWYPIIGLHTTYEWQYQDGNEWKTISNNYENNPSVRFIYKATEQEIPGVTSATVTTGKTVTLQYGQQPGGLYDLTLSVSGDRGSSEQKAMVDILFIVDKSGSMDDAINSDSTAEWYEDSRMDLVQEAISNLVNTVSANTDIDARYGGVAFARSQQRETESWTSSANSFLTWVNRLDPSGGTNYQQGIYDGKQLLTTSREGATTIVVFLSDGEPTYRGINVTNSTDGSDYSASGTGNGQDDDKGYNIAAAVTEIQSLGCNEFYAIGIGPEFTSSSGTGRENLNNLASNVKATKTGVYAADNTTDLTNAFAEIAGNVTFFACSDVTITDPLSQYAEVVADENGNYTFTINVMNGDTVEATQTVTLASGKTSETVSLDGVGDVALTFQDGVITLDFPTDYQLEEDHTYTVTTTIRPTVAATEAGTTGYNARGDAGTGDHAGQSGFWSNDNENAVVSFKPTVNGTPGEAMTEPFPKPVIQIYDPGEIEMETPAHTKQAILNEDGTYDLTLTVSGSTGTATKKAEVDVLMIVDVSNSMDDYGRIGNAQTAMKALVTALEGKEDTVDARYSIVKFSSKNNYDHDNGTEADASLVLDWNDTATTVESSIGGLEASGGTNYQAGLRLGAAQLQTARSTATTVVVFLSDGAPSYSIGGGTGSSIDNDEWLDTLKEAANISCSRFYSVGIGSTQASYMKGLIGQSHIYENDWGQTETDSSKVNENYHVNAAIAEYIQANDTGSNLADKFKEIAGSVTYLSCVDVTISDTLSQYAEAVEGAQPSIKVTDADGTDVTAAEKEEGNITASYDPETKLLTLDFADNYQLKPNYTYSVTLQIKPTTEAENEYKELNGVYPHTPDAGTGTHADLGENGFYSNKEATLTYKISGTDQSITLDYGDPVIRLTVGSLSISKVVARTDNQAAAGSNFSFTVDLQDGTFDKTVTATVMTMVLDETTGAPELDGDGSYTYTGTTTTRDVKFEDGVAEITLDHGQTIVIPNLPAAAQAAIEETTTAGYSTKWTGDTHPEGKEVVGAAVTTAQISTNPSVTCTNTTGAVLPSTGGMGVVPYFTLGSLMTIGGGLLLIRRRWKGGHAAR